MNKQYALKEVSLEQVKIACFIGPGFAMAAESLDVLPPSRLVSIAKTQVDIAYAAARNALENVALDSHGLPENLQYPNMDAAEAGRKTWQCVLDLFPTATAQR